MKKINFAFLMISIFIIGSLTAQKQVKGSVEDIYGDSLPGVSIMEKGTTNGTITDIDGNFEITVKDKDAIIKISFIGFKVIEKQVADQSNFKIVLIEDMTGLDEVVVVGYGTKTKATVTGAVEVVTAKEFESKSQTSIAQSLQGKIPGLMITRSSGDIAAKGGLSIRGITSRGGAGVLVIVDGIPQPENDASALEDINPEDVENITVLKDAQAAIYGSRAAGGVILITTKEGTTSEPTFKYSANFAMNVPDTYPKKANIFEMAEYYWEAFENDGIQNHNYTYLKDILPNVDENTEFIKGPFSDTPKMSTKYFDWMDILFDPALQQKHQFSLGGKEGKSAYHISLGVLDSDGQLAVAENNYTRYDLRLKYHVDVSDKLKVGANLKMGKTISTRPTRFGSAISQAQAVWSNHWPYTPEGNYYNFGGFLNPLAYAKAGQSKTESSEAVAGLNFELTPIKDLKIHGDYSANIDNSKTNSVWNIMQHHDYDDNPTNRSANNNAGSNSSKFEHQVANIYGNYTKTFDIHKFELMVGASHEEYDFENFSASRDGLVSETVPILDLGDPELQHTNAFRSQWAIDSYFGRLNYSLKGKYLFEGTMRADASSRFADGHRWGSFYGGSGAWLISEENFMSSLYWLDLLKVRLSYGELGNQNNVGLYDHISRIAVDGVVLYGSANSPSINATAHGTGSLASPDRSWETVEIKNIGFDYRVLENRLEGSFDYFIKDTRDMLITKEFPKLLGIAPSTINGGELRTQGFEFKIAWKDELENGLKYNVGFTLSDDKTKVTKLDDNPIPKAGLNTFVEGYAPYSYFTLKHDGYIQSEAELIEYKKLGAVPANLRVGDSKYFDLDGDGKIEHTVYKEGAEDSGDLISAGDNRRHYQYGITLGAEWKGFDFGCFFQGVAKWNVMSGLQAPGNYWWENPKAVTLGNFWSEENPNAFYPKSSANGTIHGWNYQNSDAPYKKRKADYLKLKTINFGYTLPKALVEKAFLSKVHVYFSGNDLFSWDRMPDGYDAELPYMSGFFPIPKTYSFGIDITLK